MAKQEKFTMPGRRGDKLSSGEDTQMVLHCISKGYFAGTSPALKLKHIIPHPRANIGYLKKACVWPHHYVIRLVWYRFFPNIKTS